MNFDEKRIFRLLVIDIFKNYLINFGRIFEQNKKNHVIQSKSIQT